MDINEELTGDSIENLSSHSDLDEFTQNKLIEEEKAIHKEHEKKLEGIKKNTLILGGIGILITILSVGLYILPTFFVFQDVLAEINQSYKEIDNMEVKKLTNEKTLESLYVEQVQLEEKYGDIFPLILPEVHSESQYQSAINRIAQFFEEFSLHPGKGLSPLELPSISFGKPKEGNDVFIVPIKMTIESNKESFDLFLQDINNKSGSLNEEDFYYSWFSKKSKPIPIMSIDSLNISLPKQEKSGFSIITSSVKKKSKDTLRFSVSLSAYFKATDKMKEMYGSKNNKKK